MKKLTRAPGPMVVPSSTVVVVRRTSKVTSLPQRHPMATPTAPSAKSTADGTSFIIVRRVPTSMPVRLWWLLSR